MRSFYDGEVLWNTLDWADGNYIIQVKAIDAYENLGLSEVIWFAIWNNRPRVIWVPDDHETIQAAIRASEDGDTVRVREGTYHEGLRLMGKNYYIGK